MTTQEQALAYFGLKKLPKEGSGEFEGEAIALVVADNGTKRYVIARYNPLTKRHEVKKDFIAIGGTIKDFEEFYPLKEAKKVETPFDKLSINEMIDYLNEKNIPFMNKTKKGLIDAYERYKEENE